MSHNCNFCRDEYFDEVFQMVYPQSKSGILYKTRNFYVAIDCFPVCENHLLIVPFAHKLSFSTLSKELSQEFEEILNYIKKIYNNCNNYVLFEHGSNRKNNDDKKTFVNSVTHAHMHFFPYQNIPKTQLINYCFKNENTKIKVKEGFDYKNFFYECKEKKNLLDYLKEDLPTNEPYLFFHFGQEKMESLCITENSIDGEIPSQYFRKFFVVFMNPKVENPFYNWKIPKEVQASQNQRIKIINRIFIQFK